MRPVTASQIVCGASTPPPVGAELRVMRSTVLLLVHSSLSLPASVRGQCESFTGKVRKGEPWHHPFGDGLLVRLRPTVKAPPNPPGSTIEVRAAPDSLRVRWQAMTEELGRGRLRIVDAEDSGPEDHPPAGRIERLAFEFTLCPGGEPAAAPDSERDRDSAASP